MAAKPNTVNPAQKKKQRAFEGVCKSLIPFARAAAVIASVALLLFLTPFVGIYNKDIPGMEITVGGFSAALCALSGQFTNVGAAFGNMDIFNHFAPAHCKVLAACAAAAALCLLAALVLCVVLAIGKAPGLHSAAAVLQALAFAALIVSFAFALAMSGTRLLPEYCSGNPACSVRSLAILPALAACAGCAVNFAAALRYRKAKKNI